MKYFSQFAPGIRCYGLLNVAWDGLVYVRQVYMEIEVREIEVET